MRDMGAFGAAMDRLSAAFNRPTSQAVKDAYRDALNGLTDDEFRCAVAEALTSADRWPVPKVLLSLGLKERGRMQGLHHTRHDDGAHCPRCGGLPRWTKTRMHLFHREGCDQVHLNFTRAWESN